VFVCVAAKETDEGNLVMEWFHDVPIHGVGVQWFCLPAQGANCPFCELHGIDYTR
jgi:hypothetical protein